MKKKIILTGGGTAGHIWPIVAITETLKKNQKVKYLYVGSFGKEKEIAKDRNIPFRKILVGKWRNYFSFYNFIDILKTTIGILQSFFLVLFFRPNVIFAKGGYVTFPLIFIAKTLKVPLVIHESDIEMGKSNRYALSYAKKVCLGFPLKYYTDLPLEKTIYTGTPVVKEFFVKEKIKSDRPIILITGGSQGSQKINNLTLEILPELIKRYEIYHLCGAKNFAELEKKFNHPSYHLISFSKNMAELMSKASLVISRAGANTLAEISAQRKPAILIPLPSAHLDHQTANAKIYQENNAAVTLKEDQLTSTSFLSIIDRLMEDRKTLELLGHNAGQFSKSDSAQEIIDILFENMK